MNGTLGKAALTANTYHKLFTVSNSHVATFNVAVVNRADDVAKVRIAISSEDSTPGNEDFIEYDVKLPAAGSVLERTGLVASAGESVFVYGDTGNLSARAFGFEEQQ